MDIVETSIAQLPDYMREDRDIVDALSRADYVAFCRVLDQYEHPEDKAALTAAWNPVASAAAKARAKNTMRCRECGAYGQTHHGLGVGCGCAAE